MTTAPRWLWILELCAALGCGLVAGVFFAFSSFVMRALGRLPPPQGIAAMQSINIAVINSWFMAVFMGTAAACLVLAVRSLLGWNQADNQPSAAWLLAASLLYLVGTFGVTIAFNVPLNDALANAKPHGPEADQLWASYLSSWTIWNHVRTLAALAATLSMILALCQRAPK